MFRSRVSLRFSASHDATGPGRTWVSWVTFMHGLITSDRYLTVCIQVQRYEDMRDMRYNVCSHPTMRSFHRPPSSRHTLTTPLLSALITQLENGVSTVPRQAITS